MATASSLRTTNSQTLWIVSNPEAPSLKERLRNVDILHDLQTAPAESDISRFILLPASANPVVVAVRSTVVNVPVPQMNSPEFLASVRRRRSEKMTKMLDSLAKKVHRDDFAAFTFRIADEIRSLLLDLADVKREGNTREILRQIRDTFLDGRHEQYRNQEAREALLGILMRLSDADEVTPDDVDAAFDQLQESGIAAPLPQLFLIEQDKEEPNGGGTAEIPC
jgi:hypothetical protein